MQNSFCFPNENASVFESLQPRDQKPLSSHRNTERRPRYRREEEWKLIHELPILHLNMHQLPVGHTMPLARIKRVENRGKTIILDDGSLWEIFFSSTPSYPHCGFPLLKLSRQESKAIPTLTLPCWKRLASARKCAQRELINETCILLGSTWIR